MFKNLLDYNSRENEWLRTHSAGLAAIIVVVTHAAVVTYVVVQGRKLTKENTKS